MNNASWSLRKEEHSLLKYFMSDNDIHGLGYIYTTCNNYLELGFYALEYPELL